MNKKLIIAGIAGLLVGGLITGVAASQAVRNNNAAVLRMMGVEMPKTSDHSSMSMKDMTKQLEGKTGDQFDKAFIEMMISHHEGAVDMAELAKQNAKHDEIKKLSDDIISAQNKEISEMKSWQQSWGYTGSSTHSGH